MRFAWPYALHSGEASMSCRSRQTSSVCNAGVARGNRGRPNQSVHSDARVDIFQRQIKGECFNPNYGTFTFKKLRSRRESARSAYPDPCLDDVLGEHAISGETWDTQIFG